MTTNTTLHVGHDVAYFTHGQHGGGCTGAMSYYTASGEPPGQWAGKGAESLGLTGTVDPDVIGRLYQQGVGPGGEMLLAKRQSKDDEAREEAAVTSYLEAHPFASSVEVAEVRSAVRGKSGQVTVPYYDFTISAAKSVSVLHASLKVSAGQARASGEDDLADLFDAEADQIEADLIAAAEAAIRQLEEEACYARTGHHSSSSGEWRDGAGLVAATFVHHISRDGDPQLHVHIPVANLVQRADREDDKWRGLFGRELYRQRLSVAATADREMESRLVQRYAMITRADGNGAEIAGVSQEVMDLFSSRRRTLTPKLKAKIKAYEAIHGHGPSKRTVWLLGQQAAQETRRTKAQARTMLAGETGSAEPDEQARLAAWEKQTAREELRALSGVQAAVKATLYLRVAIDAAMKERAARIAVAEVQAQHAVFSMAELRFEVHRALPVGADPETVREVARMAVAAGADVIQVAPSPEVADVTSLDLRKNGTSVYRPPNEERFTTMGQLDLEAHVIAEAGRIVEQAVSEDEARLALASSDLSAEQLEAVVGLLTTTRAMTMLSAAAGAGKTHAVGAFAKAWTSVTGRRVIGLATAENAARVMAAEAAKAGAPMTAFNIAAFLGKVKDSAELRYPVALRPGDVLVLDESSQLSTADIALVQQYARRSGATLVATGDVEQLGSVEAGGIFRMLASRYGALELTEVRRFRAEWERDASVRLRTGDKSVVAAYDTHGRILGKDRARAHASAVQGWLSDHARGKNVMLLAGTNAEASELARAVQEHLVNQGLVELPRADLSDGNRAGTGDLLRARLNCTIDAGGQRLTNRDTVKVVAWSGPDAVVRRKLEAGWSDKFVVPASYLRDNAELDYAGNIHVAQGRTVDTVHLFTTDTLNRKSFYVGMTRGRESNLAHVVTGDSGEGRTFAQTTAEAVIHSIMDRVPEDLTATEQVELAQEWSASTGHLLTLWNASLNSVFRNSVDKEIERRVSPEDYRKYTAEFSRGVLHQALRERMLAGQNIPELVTRITRDSLTGAGSVASVLHGRLKDLPASEAYARSWEARTPAGAPDLAHAAASAMDARAVELGERLAVNPEPWLSAHLRLEPDASPLLREDFVRRAGAVAAYREAAGITRPDQAIAADPHKDSPELETMRKASFAALEIRDDAALLRAASVGELESRVLSGERVQALAPPDVSGQLKVTAQAEAEARISGSVLADTLTSTRARLEAEHAQYEQWAGRTCEVRETAGKAKTELNRRGVTREQSMSDWWREFNADAEAVERALEAERAELDGPEAPQPEDAQAE